MGRVHSRVYHVPLRTASFCTNESVWVSSSHNHRRSASCRRPVRISLGAKCHLFIFFNWSGHWTGSWFYVPPSNRLGSDVFRKAASFCYRNRGMWLRMWDLRFSTSYRVSCELLRMARGVDHHSGDATAMCCLWGTHASPIVRSTAYGRR